MVRHPPECPLPSASCCRTVRGAAYPLTRPRPCTGVQHINQNQILATTFVNRTEEIRSCQLNATICDAEHIFTVVRAMPAPPFVDRALPFIGRTLLFTALPLR